jgi:hypothetical protein
MPVARDRERALAYVLRLWRVTNDEPPVWRVSLHDVHTGERRGFAGLDQMCHFLRAQIEGAPGGTADLECPPRSPQG